MSKQLWKGSTLLAPVPPALVSCGSLDAPNALTVAWTGIVCSQPPKTYISLRPERYSYGLIRQSGEFAVNLPTAAMARAGLLAYAHGEYFALGKKLGTFGFSVKKKKRAAKRAR